MTLKIIFRPPSEWGSAGSYQMVVHESVPKETAQQIVHGFADYQPEDGERFAFKTYNSLTGGRERIVVDYELAVMVLAETPMPEKGFA